MNKKIFLVVYICIFIMFSSCIKDNENTNNYEEENEEESVEIIERPNNSFVTIDSSEILFDDMFDVFTIYIPNGDGKYQYDIYTNNGLIQSDYWFQLQYYNNLTHNDLIKWSPVKEVEREYIFDFVEKAQIVIVQKEYYNILGYVVIEFKQDKDIYNKYTSDIIKSVGFPKINGKYQQIKDEYFMDLIGFQKEDLFIEGQIVEMPKDNLIVFSNVNDQVGKDIGYVEINNIYDCIKFRFENTSVHSQICTIAIQGTFQENMIHNKKDKLIRGGSQAVWSPLSNELNEDEYCEEAYILAINKFEFVNIEYVIIYIKQDDMHNNIYYANVVESVCFPQIDGKYQIVSDDYIENKFYDFIDTYNGGKA